MTIQVANDNVCSTTLVTQLLSITSKLGNLIESGLSRATKEIGFQAANKFSVFAQSWGNKIAREWASEFGFARYLAVMKINSGYNIGSI
ncbi:MAG: hypothetical protein NWF01_05900 [Candidatus Bathyarchaeota archaeon]|nr:hypothetical protein [Candidatus Bathyarchaeota archaeon]